MILKIFAAAVISYLLGSLNTSMLVGRFKTLDIRKHGSGNAGLTNTIRIFGKKAALIVFAGDVAKGVAACLISSFIIAADNYPAYAIGGFFVITGHIWPVYFRFKGGKGALTAVAVAFMIDPLSASILLLIFAAVLLTFRYVSVATITTGVLYPVVSLFITRDTYILIYSIIISILIIYKHRTNISRLLKKEEPRIGSKNKDIHH